MSEGKKFLDCIVTFKPSDDSGDIDVPLTISTEEHSEQILLRVVHKAHLDYRKQYNFNYTEWQEEDEFPGETENSPGEDQVTYEIKDNDGMKGALKDWERSSLKRKAMIVTRETNAIIAELSKEPRDKMTRNGLRTMKTLYSISLSPYNIQFIPVTLLKTLEATAKNGNDTAKSITLAILRELVDNPAMTEAIARAKTLVRTIFFVTKNRIKEIRQMRENMSENQRREVVFLEETLAGFAARLSLNPMGRQALARFKEETLSTLVIFSNSCPDSVPLQVFLGAFCAALQTEKELSKAAAQTDFMLSNLALIQTSTKDSIVSLGLLVLDLIGREEWGHEFLLNVKTIECISSVLMRCLPNMEPKEEPESPESSPGRSPGSPGRRRKTIKKKLPAIVYEPLSDRSQILGTLILWRAYSVVQMHNNPVPELEQSSSKLELMDRINLILASDSTLTPTRMMSKRNSSIAFCATSAVAVLVAMKQSREVLVSKYNIHILLFQLLKSSNSYPVQTSAASALCQLAADYSLLPILFNLSATENGMENMLDALHDNNKFRDKSEASHLGAAVFFLCHLRGVEIQKEIIEKMLQMLSHSDLQILYFGAISLWALAYYGTPTTKVKIGVCEGTLKIVDVLQNAKARLEGGYDIRENRDLIYSLLGSAYCLIQDKSQKQRFVDAKGIEMLLHLLNIPKSKSGNYVRFTALQILFLLCREKDYCTYFLENRGGGLLQVVAEDTAENESVRALALELLGWIAGGISKSEETLLEEQIGSYDELVIQLLKTEFKSDKILLSLASTMTRRAMTIKNKRFIARKGGIQALVRLLKSSDSEIVCERAAHALMNLSSLPVNQVKIAKVGLRTLISKASPDAGSRVHLFAARTLSNLSHHKSNRTKLYIEELALRTRQSRQAAPNGAVEELDNEMMGNRNNICDKVSENLRIDFSSWYDKNFNDPISSSVDSPRKSPFKTPSRPSTTPSPRSSCRLIQNGSLSGGRKGKFRNQLIDLSQGLRRPLTSVWSPRISRPQTCAIQPKNYSVRNTKNQFFHQSIPRSSTAIDETERSLSGTSMDNAAPNVEWWNDLFDSGMKEVSTQYDAPVADIEKNIFSPWAPNVVSMRVDINDNFMDGPDHLDESVDETLNEGEKAEEGSGEETAEETQNNQVNKIALIEAKQQKTHLTVVLKPNSPRSTLKFGGVESDRRDKRNQPIRLWTFPAHGAEVSKGLFEPYALPNGEEVYFYKKQSVHEMDLDYLPPEQPEVPPRHDRPSVQSGFQSNSNIDPPPYRPRVRKKSTLYKPDEDSGISLRDDPMPIVLIDRPALKRKTKPIHSGKTPSLFQERIIECNSKSLYNTTLVMDRSFERDWKQILQGKYLEGIYSEGTLKWLKKVLSEKYNMLCSLYEHCRCTDGNNSIAVTSQDFIDFIENIKFFGKVKMDSVEEQTKYDVLDIINSVCGENEHTVRYKFMQMLILLSHWKYVKNSDAVEEISVALKLFLDDYIIPYVLNRKIMHDSDLYRNQRLYARPIDTILKQYKDPLKRIFIRYCKRPMWITDDIYREAEGKKMAAAAAKEAEDSKKKKRGKKGKKKAAPKSPKSPRGRKVYWMSIQQWIRLLTDLKLINEDFTLVKAKLCFSFSRMHVIDPVKDNLLDTTLNFSDFIEAMCRVADHFSLPTPEEIKSINVDTVVDYLDLKRIEYSCGDKELTGMTPRSKHKKWARRKSEDWGETKERKLLEKLAIFVPFLVNQIKGYVTIGR
jgi:hypothetical protein